MHRVQHSHLNMQKVVNKHHHNLDPVAARYHKLVAARNLAENPQTRNLKAVALEDIQIVLVAAARILIEHILLDWLEEVEQEVASDPEEADHRQAESVKVTACTHQQGPGFHIQVESDMWLHLNLVVGLCTLVGLQKPEQVEVLAALGALVWTHPAYHKQGWTRLEVQG